MNGVLNMHGLDKLGWTYTAQAAAMANDLKLFEPSTHIRNYQLRRAREFTAWCAFHWQT